MRAEDFYSRVINAAARPPDERHLQLAAIHTHVYEQYLTAVKNMRGEIAQQTLPIDGDERTFAQLIGHIAEWDRFAVLAAGDILAGIQHPRMVTDLTGYIEPNGQQPVFASIDEFNAYQARKHALWKSEDIQSLAVEMATALHTLFTHPSLLNANKLERTKAWQKRLRNGHVIENITMGWTLWLIVIEHIGVEHAVELNALASY
jgi:hypothetical protein